MNTQNRFEIEITRHNVTPAQFLSYVRRAVDKKGGKDIRSDLDLRYFADGKDLNFDVTHTDGTLAGLHEKSVSRPYQMQTYLRWTNGQVYNEICEFDFDDEKTGFGYYYLVDVEVEDEPEQQTAPDQAEATEEETAEAEQSEPEQQNVIEKARKSIEAKTERSAWEKGVTVYAMELLDSIEEAVNGGWFDYEDLGSDKLVNKCMLNGATDWKEFSCGGLSLIYDGDIAQRLCNPSELKKTKNGTRRPNARENWIDVQARALFQASIKVREAIKKSHH